MDEKRKRMAIARLRGFRSHVAGRITQKVVDEYHSILIELEGASGEALYHYSIPPDLVVGDPIATTKKTHPFSLAGEPRLSVTKYCDKEFFRKRMDHLWAHFETGPVVSSIQRQPETQ